jgi:hypothetical protein
MIEEESIQQSLLQTKFEARRKLGNYIYSNKIVEISTGPASKPMVLSGFKIVTPSRSLSDSNQTEHNLGFLMSKLSTGLGVWYLPKGGPN